MPDAVPGSQSVLAKSVLSKSTALDVVRYEADYLINIELRDTETLLEWWYGGRSHRQALV